MQGIWDKGSSSKEKPLRCETSFGIFMKCYKLIFPDSSAGKIIVLILFNRLSSLNPAIDGATTGVWGRTPAPL